VINEFSQNCLKSLQMCNLRWLILKVILLSSFWEIHHRIVSTDCLIKSKFDKISVTMAKVIKGNVKKPNETVFGKANTKSTPWEELVGLNKKQLVTKFYADCPIEHRTKSTTGSCLEIMARYRILQRLPKISDKLLSELQVSEIDAYGEWKRNNPDLY
jgi:hypothetical protein